MLSAVVGTDGWLACVLSVVVCLLPTIVLAAWATALARYLLLWWSGWGLPERSQGAGAEGAPDHEGPDFRRCGSAASVAVCDRSAGTDA